MATKWAHPIDKLLEADEKAKSLKADIHTSDMEKPQGFENSNITKILEVDSQEIIRWEYKDRPENELGDIEGLAETLKSVGQQQPCILRPCKTKPGKYELIVGERRWRAARLANLKIKAIIKDLDDKTATLIQAIENEKRTDKSDFSKGMSYADKIERGFISQKDLTDIIGIPKQQLSRLLSYRKIPNRLFQAIEDFKKVSSRTAYEIARLSAKGEKYIQMLVDLAPKIKTGKYGHNSINKEIKKNLENETSNVNINQKIFSIDGRHLFTWRLDNNSIPSIHFPKDIANLIYKNALNLSEITEEFKKHIVKKLSEIQDQSPRGD